MKKNNITILVIMICVVSQAQIKMHPNGQVSFQSTTQTGGVQIDTYGRVSYEPNLYSSFSPVVTSKLQSKLLKMWNVKYIGTPVVNPQDRFYVTGNGDVYSNAQYTIGTGGGGLNKSCYPIENASWLISRLNGYYFDNDDFEGFKPDFINNPNIAPEAVAGLMNDLSIDKSLGLSATELEDVLPEAIRHDPEGMVYINYQALVPVLVEAFKEQQSTIKSLQNEIAALKAEYKGYNGVNDDEKPMNILFQNSPNPTNSSTTIKCILDSFASKALVAVYDLNGLQLKEYPVYSKGENTVTIEVNELKPGIYLYSLVVDGKLVDTKRMVITSK